MFDFDAPTCQISTPTKSEVEVFLSQPQHDLVTCFQNLPTMKKLFITFNTPVPSSAALECAFSLAKLILSPQRGQLSDKRFEATMIINLVRKKLK